MLASGSVLLVLLAGFGLAKLLERRTRTWPKTWATIHSADMEMKELNEKTDIMLPCFVRSSLSTIGQLVTLAGPRGRALARR